MENKEILQNNKLIAKFQYEKLCENTETDDFLVRDKNTNYIEFYVVDAKYHSSWDWLMPVIEKIMDICFECSELTGWEINDPEDFYAIRDCIPDITHTYKAVVEFIKWYNKNNKK